MQQIAKQTRQLIIISSFKEGDTLEQIGKRLGLTKVRIHQILNETGEYLRLKRINRASRQIKREERLQKKCKGCQKLFVAKQSNNGKSYCSNDCKKKYGWRRNQ